MAKVTFRNILDEDSEFRSIDREYLIPAVYEFARTSSDELYEYTLKEKVVVHINSKYIHPDDWIITKLEKDDEVVITPPLEGGKVGAIFQIVVGAALVVVGAITGQGYISIGGVQLMTGVSLAMMGAAMALGGISYFLFKPDLPNLNYGGGGNSQTYNWSGVKTMASEDMPIPVVYGTHKIGGNVISLFTERSGESDYLYMLLALCEGEIEGVCRENNHSSICITSNQMSASYTRPAIELDGQPLSDYSDVQWWYRNGANASNYTKSIYDPRYQNKIPYFDGAKVQYDDEREITAAGITYTTTKEVDMVTLQIFAPALYDSSSGTLLDKTAYYRIQFRVNGTSTWYDVFRWDWVISLSGVWGFTPTVITTPSSHIYVSYTHPENIHTATKPSDVTMQILQISPDTTFEFEVGDNFTATKWYTVTVALTAGGVTTIGYVNILIQRDFYPIYYPDQSVGYYPGPTYFVPGYITFKEYTIGLTNLISTNNIYTITSAIPTSAYDNYVSGKTKTGVWSSVTLDFNNILNGSGNDVYQIRLFRPYGDASNQLSIADTIELHSVLEIVQGKFIYPDTALLGFRIRASGQISGAPPQVTTVIKGEKVQVPAIKSAVSAGTNVRFDNCYWDNGDNRWENIDDSVVYWNNAASWRTEWSNNAMVCVRDMVLNTRYGIGDYFKTTDLYPTTTIIKECHKVYYPTSIDRLYWWDNGPQDTFGNHISPLFFTNQTLSINSTARKINLSNAYLYGAAFDFNCPLSRGETYRARVTLASVNASCNLKFWLWDNVSGWNSGVVTDLTNKSSGTHVTNSFIAKNSGFSKLGLMINNADSLATLTMTISDVSLDRSATAPSVGSVSKMHYHTWDGVLETGQSALAALLEMCDSFRTWPIWYDGKINFVADTDDTPVHTLSKGNTTSFSQSFAPLSEIPHKLIGQYTDEDEDYDMRSLAARSTSTTLTKLNENTVGLKGITNRKKAERELKWKLNKVTNCSHTVSVKCGLDYIHATAGDIIYLQDDLPQWGEGGRVLSYNSTTNKIVLNASVTVATVSATYIVRYQNNENSFVVATVNTASHSNNEKTQTIKVNGFPGAAYPTSNSVFVFGKTGSFSKKFRLINVSRTEENEVELAGVEHLSELYTTEPVISVVEDRPSQLPNPLLKPKPPINAQVNPLPAQEGIGFILKADPPLDSPNVIEILVQMKEYGQDSSLYQPIATIPIDRRWAKYINNSLILDKTYDFRFMSRTIHKVSDPVDLSCYLSSMAYIIDPPTGIYLVGYPCTHTYDGKDVTIAWNPPNNPMILKGYVIEIYHTSVSGSNLLRTQFISGETFTYTFENMMDDAKNSMYGTVANPLIFIVYSKNTQGQTSVGNLRFDAYNSVPEKLMGVVAVGVVGGVNFSWDKSEEKDHKSYEYKIKIGSGGWSTPTYIGENNFTRILTSSEVMSYGNNPSVKIAVRDYDWYQQSSATYVQAVASSNKIVDDLFQMAVYQSGGSGYTASIYDSNISSGGITIT